MTLQDIQNYFEMKLNSKDIRVNFIKINGKKKQGFRYIATRLSDGIQSTLFVNDSELK